MRDQSTNSTTQPFLSQINNKRIKIEYITLHLNVEVVRPGKF